MAKNFDAKEFMIQKGERVGLFVALILMIALVGFGMADGVAADSVDKTVDSIKDKSKQIEDRIVSGPSGSDVTQPLDLIYTKTDVIGIKLDPNAYLAATPFFRETPLENRKRTNPVVLQPDEFNPVLVRGAVQSMMVFPQKDRVQMGVLIPLDKSKSAPVLSPQQKMWMDMMQQRLAMMQAMGMRVPAGVNPAPGGMPGIAAGAGPEVEYRLDYVDAAKMPANAEPAMTVTPVRMAVISGSFPYRAQLEIYRAALRKESLQDLVKENGGELIPHFLQFNVRRRALDHTGKEKEAWRELNLDADFKPLLAKALGTETDTPEIRRLSNHGMVMPRPILAVGKYPDTTPGLVSKALRVINQKIGKDSEVKVLSQMEKRLAGDGLDIFGAQPMPEPDKNKLKGDAPPPRGEPEMIVPDHCLVRFIDVAVQPGFTYEYQVQIRVQNPNFGKKTEVAYPSLAEPKEIIGPWSEKPCSITIPRETYVYGIELDDRALRARQQLEPKLLPDKNDVTFMQIHRWVESTNLNPEQRGASVPVGDWSIGDCAVRRGEQIGRLENVKVAMWTPTKKAFEIAVPIQAAVKPGVIGVRPQPVRGIPINFVTEDLLVDFEGGTIRQNLRLNEKTSKPVSEDANVEYLVMSPDGKLHLRQSRADKANTDRSARFDEWAAHIADVEAGRGKLSTGGGDKGPMKDPFKKP